MKISHLRPHGRESWDFDLHPSGVDLVRAIVSLLFFFFGGKNKVGDGVTS